ncbi:hypothetical protein ACFVQ9_26070 [Streptomyces goshikiensis]|uniref:hypothetical protein n=1 Tax=Streptomyces goshikiensis TaxID=1942 RepID=UPI0036864ACA
MPAFRLGPVRDRAVRALLALGDHAARHSGVPNPMAATRVVLAELADQNHSGADFIDTLTWQLDRLGFTWAPGLCETCDAPLTDDEAESTRLCASCDV